MPAISVAPIAVLASVSPPVVPPSALSSSDIIHRAVVAQRTGEFRTALRLLNTANQARPHDPEILRLLGSTYAFMGRYRLSIAALLEARSLAPSDSDIGLALARSYLWAGRLADARAAASAVAARDPTNAELGGVSQSIAAAYRELRATPRRLSIALGASIADVDAGGRRQNWSQERVSLAVPVNPRSTVSAEFDRENRSGPVDTSLYLRLDQRLGRAVSGYIAASVTPNASFRERWGVRAGAELGASATVSGVIDVRYSCYRSINVYAVEPGIRIHDRQDRHSLTLKSINLIEAGQKLRSGWSARADIATRGAIRLYAGGASYPDTEAGVTRRVRSAFAGAAAPLARDVDLRFGIEHENRVQSYRRDSVSLSVSWRLP